MLTTDHVMALKRHFSDIENLFQIYDWLVCLIFGPSSFINHTVLFFFSKMNYGHWFSFLQTSSQMG